MRHEVRQYIQNADASQLALRHEIATSGVLVAGLHVQALLYKYSPGQPRVPAGNPDGGQWTDGGGGSGGKQPEERLAGRARGRSGPRNLTPVQRINRRRISAAKRNISQINPSETYLEPVGGSTSPRALRSFNQRLKTLKAEAAGSTSQITYNNHSFAKHEFVRGFVQTPAHTRFTNITTREQYAGRIYDTIVNGTHSRVLERGRTGYYNARTNTIVVVNPRSRDGGTSYPAFNGLQDYYKLN